LVMYFNLYVYFPEARWPGIQKAEQGPPDGQKSLKLFEMNLSTKLVGFIQRIRRPIIFLNT